MSSEERLWETIKKGIVLVEVVVVMKALVEMPMPEEATNDSLGTKFHGEAEDSLD